MDLFDCRTFVGQFDEALIRHQVKYLGLMEHLRVRRAGFAYRRKYEDFLKRCHSVPHECMMDVFRHNCLCVVVYLAHFAGTNLCAQPPGLTGEDSLLMVSSCWLSIWATCLTSTKWDGEDNSYTSIGQMHFLTSNYE